MPGIYIIRELQWEVDAQIPSWVRVVWGEAWDNGELPTDPSGSTALEAWSHRDRDWSKPLCLPACLTNWVGCNLILESWGRAMIIDRSKVALSMTLNNTARRRHPLGVVTSGGESTRFGSPRSTWDTSPAGLRGGCQLLGGGGGGGTLSNWIE